MNFIGVICEESFMVVIKGRVCGHKFFEEFLVTVNLSASRYMGLWRGGIAVIKKSDP